ncbi:MAG TPA: AAA family ATPase, partial [Armatimonadota bacterium]|nr:AAA family ATPase [Armatimonadota bacterium]
MIVRRLSVQGLRCFRNPLEIGPFGEGINIIFAPNESGKSTLIDAIARALFDRHTVTGEKIEALRPWGTQLAPEIELDFVAAGKSYRLLKRFLGDPVARLSVIDGATAVLEMERDHADDFVRALMVAEAPGRGVSKPEHWGIARTLWCLQGGAGAGALEVSESVAQQLRRALPGGAITSPVVKLLERLDRRYATYYTDTGRVKKDSPLQRLEQEIARGRERVNAMRADYDAARQAAERLQGIARELERVQEEHGECRRRIARYEEEAGAVRALRARLEALLELIAPHDREYRAIAADLGAGDAAARRVKELEDRQKETAAQLEEAITDRKAAEQVRLRAQRAWDAARQSRARTDAARTRGRNIAEALTLRDQLGGLERQQEAVAALLAQRQAKEQELRSLPCPTDAELRAARELQHRITSLQGQLKTAGLVATIAFERDLRLEIRRGEDEAASLEGTAGQVELLHPGATLHLTLPGVMHVHVTSGDQEAQTLEDELRQADRALQALLARYGARDDADLVKKQVAWQALEQEVARLGGEIATALGTHASADALRDALADRRKALTICCHALGITPEEVPALEPPDAQAQQLAYDAALKEEETQRALLDDQQEHCERCRKAEAALRDGRAEALRALEREQSVIQTILTSRGCADLAALRSLVETSAARLHEAREAHASAQADLPDPA